MDTSEQDAETARLVTLTADVVSAYVSNNHVQSAELPKLLGEVHEAIRSVSLSGRPTAETGPPKATPQEIRKSISHDFLVSFEDGKPYKTLRRHLAGHGLTPEQYRERYKLKSDYPMVAEAYSEARRMMAKKIGLGRKPGQKVTEAAPEAPVAKLRRSKAKATEAAEA